MGFYKNFQYKIYAIRRKSDGQILYVGQTLEPLNKRLSCHIRKARENQSRGNVLSKWHSWLVANPYEILEIFELDSGIGVPLESYAHERRFIEKFADQGVALLNSNNGV